MGEGRGTVAVKRKIKNTSQLLRCLKGNWRFGQSLEAQHTKTGVQSLKWRRNPRQYASFQAKTSEWLFPRLKTTT